MIRLIVACDRQQGIAKQGVQPWKLPQDETYFAEMTKTKGAKILVGSTTFRTFKGPLPGRQNYVLTSSTEPIDGATLVHDLQRFLADFHDHDPWVIGGAAIYEQCLNAGLADEIYITRIEADFGCDQFFPVIDAGFHLANQSDTYEQNGYKFRFETYVK